MAWKKNSRGPQIMDSLLKLKTKEIAQQNMNPILTRHSIKMVPVATHSNGGLSSQAPMEKDKK
jgi:hypothetical protein